ncbi:MAG: TonB-dependent receptor [Bacteroidales bacterium]|nr:TonB-dependent receptor [Bacteroidales bacterium]
MKNNYTERCILRARSVLPLLILLMCFNIDAFSQAVIKGTVTDEKGELLPGANIVVKGTTIGTISDFDGNYNLANVPEGQQTICVSFMGYQTVESDFQFISGSTISFNFTLKEDNEQLEEVVVIGYGVQKKKLVTGANAQVSGDDLAKMNTTNALQALQGQTAGVNIAASSGQPGEKMKVSVRGVGSLNGSDPLYIVDGVQTSDISYLNNSDIESIDILKDAASAAIYGSQASNGVVLITTKGGKKGHSQIYFDGYYGVQTLAKKVNMLSTRDYAMIINEQAANSGTSIANLPFDLNNLPSYVNSGVASTDWLDEMFVDDAAMQSYTVGATGGNDISTYAISLGYMGQEGIVGGKDESDYNRYTARINSEHKLYDGILKVGEHISYSHVKKNGIQVGNQYGNSLRSAFNTSPLLPMYDDNGEYFNTAANQLYNGQRYWLTSEANPYASMYYGNQNLTKETKVVGDLYFAVEPVKNLIFRSSIGMDYYGSDYRKFIPEYQLSDYTYSDVSKVEQNQQNSSSLSWDNTLSYGFKIGNHKFDAMAGTWMQRYDYTYLFAYNTNVAYTDFEHAWINNATSDNTNGTMRMNGNPAETRMLSYFGRLQWNFKEKYMVNATFRADGSSRFTEENRWGYFPSVSAGWVVSEEAFMQDQHVFDMLKIRGSWGQVGNQSISDFQYLATIAFTNATYPFGVDGTAVQGDGGTSSNGSYPARLANMDLKWETSEQLDFGFDARFLKNTLTVNFDWYQKTTKDWLIVAPVVGTAGADAPYINGGNCKNTGVELGITYQNHIGKDFNYNISLNGSYNKNEVTEIPTDDGIIHGSTNQLYDNSTEFYRCESGHAVGYFWGYETAGVFQNQAEINQWIADGNGVRQSKVQPGDIKYVDQNKDGKIDDEDKVDLGSPNPKYMYGLTLSCDYKALDFMVSANGVAGNKIVQSLRNLTNKNANYTEAILDRWHGEGTSNTIPRVTDNAAENYQFSDLFVQKGDYLRISNITLGYDFCKQFKVPAFTQLRVYFSVQNLYTFTKYDGLDPEVGYGIDGGVTDKFSSGIDLGFYPRPRTFMFGVNLKL